jgi:hypothetical protein
MLHLNGYLSLNTTSIVVRLISVDDDALARLFLLQSLTVLDEEGPDASCIPHIVHLPNHIGLPVVVSHGRQYVVQSTRMHGDVVLHAESVDQVGSSAAASLPVVLPNALDEGEDDLHSHMVGVVDVYRRSATPISCVDHVHLLLIPPARPQLVQRAVGATDESRDCVQCLGGCLAVMQHDADHQREDKSALVRAPAASFAVGELFQLLGVILLLLPLYDALLTCW